MSKKDEALKLALEYRPTMDKEVLHSWATEMKKAAQEALAEQKSGIKQVIELYDSPEQPARQEPVACKTLCEQCVERSYDFCANVAQTTPLPSPPPQRKPLTESEAKECLPIAASTGKPQVWFTTADVLTAIRNAEAAHNIKENT